MNKPNSYYIQIKTLVLLITFGFIFYSCDLFSTRSAEGPTQPKSNFEPAIDVNTLVKNFINSFEDKDVTNYLSCLSDTSFTNKKFHFYPSSEAASIYPSLMDWSRDKEEQYFRNMSVKLSNKSQIILEFTDVSINTSPDSTIYTATYKLNLPFVNTNSEVTLKTYKGSLSFVMMRDPIRSYWSIYSWKDIKTGSDPSWSDLKGSFAN